MLNQVVLVGRLVDKPEVNEFDGKKISCITLAVPRSYKNENGEYGTDFIDCELFNMIADNTAEYCNKGDMIGVRGRIETTINNKSVKVMKVIADKISFLCPKKYDD